MPKNVLPLEQTVTESLSQEKTKRASARDHRVCRVTLGDACKRALYGATSAQRFELVMCHLQYQRASAEASPTKNGDSGTQQVQGTPLWLVLLLFKEV